MGSPSEAPLLTEAEVAAEYQSWCRLHPQDADTFGLFVLSTTPHRLSVRATPEEDDEYE